MPTHVILAIIVETLRHWERYNCGCPSYAPIWQEDDSRSEKRSRMVEDALHLWQQ